MNNTGDNIDGFYHAYRVPGMSGDDESCARLCSTSESECAPYAWNN